MTFQSLPEFDKDLKHLIKKYSSLNEDISILKKVLEIFPKERPPFSFRLNNISKNNRIIKIKKIACKSLMGKGANTGLRIIYDYIEEQDLIFLIELYHKSSKETENRERIILYCNGNFLIKH